MNNINSQSFLIVFTYPLDECGIATYTFDLVQSMNKQSGNGVIAKICALENESEKFDCDSEVNFILNTIDTDF